MIPQDRCRVDDAVVPFDEAHRLLDEGATDVECDHDRCPRECPNWSPDLVTICEAGPFPCTLQPGAWNGFALPEFTEEQARQMLDALLAADEDWLRWEFIAAPGGSAFAIYRREDGEEGPETWPINERGLYPIGAHAWTWEIVDGI